MRVFAVSLAAVALLTGCGGNPVTAPTGSIKVSMTEYAFSPNSLSAPAGKVVFFLVNDGKSQSHDMIIRDSSGKRVAGSDLISVGDSVVFTVNNIAAGVYTVYCDQPGHEGSGMKGTLTIT